MLLNLICWYYSQQWSTQLLFLLLFYYFPHQFCFFKLLMSPSWCCCHCNCHIYSHSVWIWRSHLVLRLSSTPLKVSPYWDLQPIFCIPDRVSASYLLHLTAVFLCLIISGASLYSLMWGFVWSSRPQPPLWSYMNQGLVPPWTILLSLFVFIWFLLPGGFISSSGMLVVIFLENWIVALMLTQPRGAGRRTRPSTHCEELSRLDISVFISCGQDTSWCGSPRLLSSGAALLFKGTWLWLQCNISLLPTACVTVSICCHVMLPSGGSGPSAVIILPQFIRILP